MHDSESRGTPQSVADDQLVAAALANVVASGPGIAGRPGLVRMRLENALGEAHATRLRSLIHQVTSAAEEHVPATLAARTPLDSAAVTRVADELASARGWTPAVAERAVRLWVAALGHEKSALAAHSLPPHRSDEHAGNDTGHGVAMAPPEWPTAPPAGTATPAPNQPAWQWSAPSEKPLKRLRGAGIAGYDAAVRAYRGIPLMVFTGCVVVAAIGGLGLQLLDRRIAGLLTLPFVIAMAAIASRVRPGYVAVNTSVLLHVDCDSSGRPILESATTRSILGLTVAEGVITTVFLDGRRIELGPRSRRFGAVLAAASRPLA